MKNEVEIRELEHLVRHKVLLFNTLEKKEKKQRWFKTDIEWHKIMCTLTKIDNDVLRYVILMGIGVKGGVFIDYERFCKASYLSEKSYPNIQTVNRSLVKLCRCNLIVKVGYKYYQYQLEK